MRIENNFVQDDPEVNDEDKEEKRLEDISSWDMEFLKVDNGTLFELTLVRRDIL